MFLSVREGWGEGVQVSQLGGREICLRAVLEYKFGVGALTFCYRFNSIVQQGHSAYETEVFSDWMSRVNFNRPSPDSLQTTAFLLLRLPHYNVNIHIFSTGIGHLLPRQADSEENGLEKEDAAVSQQRQHQQSSSSCLMGLISFLASRPEAVRVSALPRGQLFNAVAARIVQGASLTTTPLWDRGVDGTDQVVQVGFIRSAISPTKFDIKLFFYNRS